MAKSWKENNTLFKESYDDFYLSMDEVEDAMTFLAQLKECEDEYYHDNSMEAWDAFDELDFFDELGKWEDDIDPAIEKIADYYKEQEVSPSIGEVYDLLNEFEEA